MRAAEGQKWSYVEMILNSEVEEKLRCGKEWKKEMKGTGGAFLRGRGEREGETSREAPPPCAR